MGYSRVSVPRALPWADLWLPLRGAEELSASRKLAFRVGVVADTASVYNSIVKGSSFPIFLMSVAMGREGRGDWHGGSGPACFC